MIMTATIATTATAASTTLTTVAIATTTTTTTTFRATFVSIARSYNSLFFKEIESLSSGRKKQ